MLRNFFLGILLFASISSVIAQKSVHDYKYVIVPKEYEFLKSEDAYQLNSLTKFLFNKYGFSAFLQGDQFPEDLAINGCMALQANVKKDSGLFVTRLLVSLRDCNGNEIFVSEGGQSKEKEYKTAYHEALRNAFKSIERLKYKYNQKKQEKEDAIPAKAPEVSQKEITPRKDVVVAKVKEEAKSTVVLPESPEVLQFSFNGNAYRFKKTEYGFEVFQKTSSQDLSIGKIYKMERENSYLVQAGNLSGGGYFDGFNNFVLERINPATSKLIKDILARN